MKKSYEGGIIGIMSCDAFISSDLSEVGQEIFPMEMSTVFAGSLLSKVFE